MLGGGEFVGRKALPEKVDWHKTLSRSLVSSFLITMPILGGRSSRRAGLPASLATLPE